MCRNKQVAQTRNLTCLPSYSGPQASGLFARKYTPKNAYVKLPSAPIISVSLLEFVPPFLYFVGLTSNRGVLFLST